MTLYQYNELSNINKIVCKKIFYGNQGKYISDEYMENLTNSNKWLFDRRGKLRKFEYCGFSFVAIRKLNEIELNASWKDFACHLRRDKFLENRINFDYKAFYEASKDNPCDIFFCMQTKKNYIPCSDGLMEYYSELRK